MLALLQKEFKLELRRKTVIAAIVLYLVSTALICYLTFSLRHEPISPPVWSALLWIIILFGTVNASAKSFIGEKAGTDLYFFSIASAGEIILAKMVYNFLLGGFIAITSFLLMAIFLENPVTDLTTFAITLLLGSGALAVTLTIISAIAARAGNSNVLMAVLGFPLVVAIILPVVKITRNTIDGLDWSISQPDVIILIAINCLAAAVSYLLFPYIWRS